MANIGDKLTDEELCQFMKDADENGDGKISYEGEYSINMTWPE